MALETTPDFEEARMAARAVMEEAEAISLDMVGQFPSNRYARDFRNAVDDAILALDDLAEEITTV